MEITNEKMSQTQKRYTKYVGQLMWARHSTWNMEKAMYTNSYSMCMVMGVRQRWNNRWQFEIMELENTSNSDAGQTYYRQASAFIASVEKGIYKSVKENPERPNTNESQTYGGNV